MKKVLGKEVNMYSSEEMSEARLKGFMDCIGVMSKGGLSAEGLRWFIAGYKRVWKKEYERIEEDGQQSD